MTATDSGHPSRPNAATNALSLPQHLHHLSAPMQVWEYVRHLQEQLAKHQAIIDKLLAEAARL